MSGPIDDIAADWVVRLAAEQLSSHQQAQLDAWVAADPRHQGALLRAQAVWQDIDRLSSLHGRIEVDAVSAPAHRFIPTDWRYAAAFLVAILIAAGAWWKTHPRPPVQMTAIGEMRQVVLPEGSILTLNTDSKAMIAFDEDRRRVTLEKGEASFKVAHDARRPFVVEAGNTTIKAVGTAFDVRIARGGINIIVTEGVVDLQTGPTAASPPRRVTKNTAAQIPSNGPLTLSELPDHAAEKDLAWQSGLLVFEGESLATAAAEFSRYSPRPIRISGSRLAARPIFGVFKTHDAAAFAKAAAATLGARVAESDTAIELLETPR